MAKSHVFVGPTDLANSRGAALHDFGRILRQDRGKFRRFERRDDQSSIDPTSGNHALRTRIPLIRPGSDWVAGRVLSGEP